jgi:hypothetical protein
MYNERQIQIEDLPYLCHGTKLKILTASAKPKSHSNCIYVVWLAIINQ